MSKLVNNLPQRIYRNDEVVLPGEPFESDSDFDKETFPSYTPPTETTPVADPADGRAERVADVTALSGALSTAALRDRLDPESETTVKGTGEHRLANQPSAGGPAEIVRDDVTDPNAPPPATADDPNPERPDTASAVLDRLAGEDLADVPDVGDDEPGADSDGPDFASEAAEQAADDLDVDPSSIEGTGKDGAITVADVKAAADS